jgi:hypothetical protein
MVTEVRLTVDWQQVTSQITRFWVSAARQRFAAETAQIGGSRVTATDQPNSLSVIGTLGC